METIARDIMATELITIREGTSVEEAVRTLINNKITGLPVVNAEGKMIGVLSEFDILYQISKESELKPEIFQKPIQFSVKVEAIAETTKLSEIVSLFVDRKFRRLPVTDSSGKLTGIITRRDLMRLFYYRARLS